MILLPLALLALVPRLWLAWLPIERLVRFVPDDSFYYFVIARNISDGLGSTFDGVGPTNGYHPLWLLVITPLWWVFDGGDAPVHLALTVGALLGMGSALLVYFIGVELGNRAVGVIASVLFAVVPRSVQLSVDGLETSLALSLGLSCLLLAHRYVQSPGTARVSALAVCSGLLLLARTDSVFLVGFIGLAVLIIGARRRRLDEPLRFAAIALLILAPWLAWNLATFGSIVQVSGEATPWMLHETGREHRGLSRLTAYTFQFLQEYGVAYSYSSFQMILALAALLALRLARDTERRGTALLLLLPVLHLASLLAVHGAYRSFPRIWYFTLLIPILALTVAIGLAGVSPSGLWYRLALLAAVVIVVLSQRASLERLRSGDYAPQVRFLEAARRVDDLPAGSTVAAFNSGILRYYSSKRVINLDGVVSNAAFDALQSYALDDYLRRQNVQYLADWDLFTLDQYAPFLRGVSLAELERLDPSDPVFGTYHLYTVDAGTGAAARAPGLVQPTGARP